MICAGFSHALAAIDAGTGFSLGRYRTIPKIWSAAFPEEATGSNILPYDRQPPKIGRPGAVQDPPVQAGPGAGNHRRQELVKGQAGCVAAGHAVDPGADELAAELPVFFALVKKQVRQVFRRNVRRVDAAARRHAAGWAALQPVQKNLANLRLSNGVKK
jgi:hypothetical protein